MNLMRGFRRLSLLTGITGLVLVLSLSVGLETGAFLFDSIEFYWFWQAVLFAGLPALFVLGIGWVITDFGIQIQTDPLPTQVACFTSRPLPGM